MTTDGFVVPASLAGERVDRAVALHTGWSRSEVQGLVDRALVTVDDRVVAKSRRLEAGESVAILGAPDVSTHELHAEDVPIDVVYDDADVVVIAKPAGLVVHPGAGNDHGTLVHGLLARYPDTAEVGDPERPGIVHRLDRDTSGLLVCARTQSAYESLVAQLAERSVERRYDRALLGRARPARRRDRHADRPLADPSHTHGRQHRRARRTHPLRGVRRLVATGRGPPHLQVGDWPHPPDPGAPRGHRQPSGRRRHVSRRPPVAADAPPVPACRASLVHPSGEPRAPELRHAVASGSRGGTS